MLWLELVHQPCRLAFASGAPQNSCGVCTSLGMPLPAAHASGCSHTLSPAYSMPIMLRRAQHEAQTHALAISRPFKHGLAPAHTQTLQTLGKHVLHDPLLHCPHPAAAQRHSGCLCLENQTPQAGPSSSTCSMLLCKRRAHTWLNHVRSC